MALLAEIAAAADPSLAGYAVADPPVGEWERRLDDPVRSFVFEAVYEAFQLHYGEPRAFAGMDADLRLLAGDAMYALALQRLADRGDLRAISELADLISLSAVAQTEGKLALVRQLWEASADALSRPGGQGARAHYEAARGRRQASAKRQPSDVRP